jgi:hypothetical protein
MKSFDPVYAINSWRFPVDNPDGQLPLDVQGIEKGINDILPLCSLEIACDTQNWLEEVLNAGLGN